MPVTEVTKDPEALTMTVTAEFAADPERVWRLYEDPRQIERWWGPPGYPSTFLEHELRDGGSSHYFMRGPDGEEYHGVWKVVSVDAPRSFSIDDAFADLRTVIADADTGLSAGSWIEGATSVPDALPPEVRARVAAIADAVDPDRVIRRSRFLA